jgi:hypothetical protein
MEIIATVLRNPAWIPDTCISGMRPYYHLICNAAGSRTGGKIGNLYRAKEGKIDQCCKGKPCARRRNQPRQNPIVLISVVKPAAAMVTAQKHGSHSSLAASYTLIWWIINAWAGFWRGKRWMFGLWKQNGLEIAVRDSHLVCKPSFSMNSPIRHWILELLPRNLLFAYLPNL